MKVIFFSRIILLPSSKYHRAVRSSLHVHVPCAVSEYDYIYRPQWLHDGLYKTIIKFLNCLSLRLFRCMHEMLCNNGSGLEMQIIFREIRMMPMLGFLCVWLSFGCKFSMLSPHLRHKYLPISPIRSISTHETAKKSSLPLSLYKHTSNRHNNDRQGLLSVTRLASFFNFGSPWSSSLAWDR